MWYSATKIGIHAIDLDHANLDFMLTLAMHQEVDENFLDDLVKALASHFLHEQQVIEDLGRSFPQYHLNEHAKLNLLFKEYQAEWRQNRLSTEDFAQRLKQSLLLHVSEFDLKLTECLEDPT